MTEKTRRWRYLCLGHFFVALGTIGVIIPGLPTVPFLLLASGYYARSSQRLYNWLHRSRWFGRYLQNWERDKSITPWDKTKAVISIAIGISATSYFFIETLLLQAMLVAIGVVVSLYIVTRPSPRTDKAPPLGL